MKYLCLVLSSFFPVRIRNRLISAVLEPVLSHIEKSFIAFERPKSIARCDKSQELNLKLEYCMGVAAGKV